MLTRLQLLAKHEKFDLKKGIVGLVKVLEKSFNFVKETYAWKRRCGSLGSLQTSLFDMFVDSLFYTVYK
jgi:hypothetical protein